MLHGDNTSDKTDYAATACDTFSLYLGGMHEVYMAQFGKADTALARNIGKGILLGPVVSLEFLKNSLPYVNSKTAFNAENFGNAALKTGINIFLLGARFRLLSWHRHLLVTKSGMHFCLHQK